MACVEQAANQGLWPVRPDFEVGRIKTPFEITHFYSKKNDTAEMRKLLHLLVKKYKTCRKLYLPWDAAGWHASKRFLREIMDVSSRA